MGPMHYQALGLQREPKALSTLQTEALGSQAVLAAFHPAPRGLTCRSCYENQPHGPQQPTLHHRSTQASPI